MKLFLVVFLLVVRVSISFCQTYNGLVKSTINGDAVQYACVRIKNTSLGVICNDKGQFTISIKDKKPTIVISCIGFESLEASIDNDLSNKIYYLKPFSKTLDEILVKSNSPTSILNKAFEQIANNYSLEKTNLEGYYNELTIDADSEVVYNGEAYMTISMPPYSDSKAGEIKLIKQRCFKMSNADSLIGAKFNSGIFNIYEDDFVRQRKKMIDPNKFTEYEYSFDDTQNLDSMTLYVISFKNKQVEKGKAGVNGTIFIDSASYAYVKITLNVDPRGFFKIGDYEKLPETRVVTYQKSHNKWILSHWNSISNGRNLKSKKSYKIIGNYYTTDFNPSIDKVIMNKTIPINKKDVFSDLNYDSSDDFWSGFSVIEDYNIYNSIKNYLKKHQ